jgi:histidine triad (HIT) family protein
MREKQRLFVWYHSIHMSTEPSIFTRIINREIPAEILYEDATCIVIPDKFPSMPGQLVVIPKEQKAYIAELPEHTYSHLMNVVRLSMQAMDQGLGTIRTCVVIEGFETPHVHVRLYPCIQSELVLEPRYEASDEELATLARTLQPYFKK